MKFFVIIYSLLLIILIKIDTGQTQYCTKKRVIPKTVVKTQTFMKLVTYKTIFGRTKLKAVSQLRTVTDVEYTEQTTKTCCSGYVLVRKTCVPLCDQICENSKCTAPNQCTCNPGYIKFNEFRCLASCDDCQNGFCSAPNVCDCYSGYEHDTSGKCQPKCSQPCTNGYCSQPEFCSCNVGYSIDPILNDTICRPICDEPCKFGDCIEPNKCECWEDYEMSSNGSCISKCDNCTNGNCIEPNVCDCYEGFLENNEGVCQPECSPKCIHGRCIEPNVCNCNDGYEIHENDTSICKPICKQDCTNGECIEPDKCSCLQGYNETSSGYCEPICDDDCENGKCIQPDQCECNEGFFESIEGICEPECNPKCVHGKCILSNECECDDGYEYGQDTNETHICSLKCYDGCTENGYCYEPYKCKCFDDGYIFDYLVNRCDPMPTTITEGNYDYLFDNTTSNSTSFTSTTEYTNNYELSELILKLRSNHKDLCNSNCLTENCTIVNCFCPTNCYSDNKTYQYKINCEAIEKHTCSCSDGSNEASICTPICDDECIFGFCTGPNECDCYDGYILNGSVCEPICNNDRFGCINGTCIKPDICECDDELYLDSNNKFLCTDKQNIQSYNSRPGKTSLIIFYIILLIILVGAIVIVNYFIYKKFGKKDYHVYKKENCVGLIQYTKENENVAVI